MASDPYLVPDPGIQESIGAGSGLKELQMGTLIQVSTQYLLEREVPWKEQQVGIGEGFPEEVVFELGPEGQAGVCQAEDREGCSWQGYRVCGLEM